MTGITGLGRAQASAVVLLVLAATTTALLAPLVMAAVLLVVGATACHRRGALLLLGLGSLLANLLLFGLFGGGPTTGNWIPIHVGGLALGAAAALRLAAVAAINLGAFALLPLERLLDGLRLPARVAGTLAAVALCARDAAMDAQRHVEAARLDGAWPAGRWARLRQAARLLPGILVGTVRRAETRREALRLAGHDLAPGWTPIVALASIALAGRFALLALPNVAFTYVVVFTGGILFGPMAGAAAGLLAMGLSDLVLTGLQPVPFANAPAMAVLGLLGGLLRRLDWTARSGPTAWVNRVLAAAIGLAATAAFSLVADATTWLLVPDYRAQPGSLRILAAAGLAFNVLPAVVNGFLFAVAIGPLARAWRDLGDVTPGGTATARRPPPSA